MIPPVYSQEDMDRVAADLRANMRMPAAFWIVTGLGILSAFAFGLVLL